MSEQEREILENIINGFQYMSDFEKGYVLGVARTRESLMKDNASGCIGELEFAVAG